MESAILAHVTNLPSKELEMLVVCQFSYFCIFPTEQNKYQKSKTPQLAIQEYRMTFARDAGSAKLILRHEKYEMNDMNWGNDWKNEWRKPSQQWRNTKTKTKNGARLKKN